MIQSLSKLLTHHVLLLFLIDCRKEKPVGHTSGRRRIPLPPKNISKTFLWGATGEQEWTPAITTGNITSKRITFLFIRDVQSCA